MSYQGPDFDVPQPERPGRLRRGLLTVSLAALVPGALLGWLVYEAVGDPGGSDTAAPPSASGSASASGSPSGSEGPLLPSYPGQDDKGGGSSPTRKPSAPAASGPLKGKVVVVDPGHNPGNFRHTAEINRQVDIGTNRKECDTTGTSTNAGYSEARFTLDVAHRLRALLEAQGATVKLTHDGDSPAWGPCVDERARIGNDAHADAAVSIHADGAASGDRGFHVILPGAVHSGSADTRPIVSASRDLGERIAGNFVRVTGEAPSNYLGGGTGLVTRKDLGGLNLSTVPKVFIECGNMRDSKDAASLTSGAWRQKAAQGISEGIVSFLRGS
ncbi:N-acetylmuramoyl-L-alanine amidase [Streptomyces sp. CB01373]|uniref:N-acetylmuramoyl-L-alanine amidase n=1 Tax=Streptomyces sp. CB01373 TaxID=2020325 RepID=UPI000C271ECB|nr:N-acetylmuramoyl-L-alanine amidase [Streptomyces sp. CB01373]PJM97180.1 N-acetylmuramoyl-L-alanine amidase [Streptomyces sp. CB01373]